MPTVQIEIRQISPATSETVIRGHQVRVDRPAAKGGDDNGPMGGELILAGLGGCFMSNLLAAIRAREAAVTNVSTEVTATLAEHPSRFSAIDLRVSCFMSNLLAAIRAREAAVTNVSTEVTATLAEHPSRFSAIDLRVSADCDDHELLEKLVTIAERGCIAANTLRGGVDLTVRAVQAKPAASVSA